MGFPGGSAGKSPAANAGDVGLIPGLGRFLEKKMAAHFSILQPGKLHGQRSLVGYSPWSCKELNMTWRLNSHNQVVMLSNVPKSGFVWLDGIKYFWQDHYWSDVISLSFSVHHFRRCMSVVCAANDIDFDYLVKVLNDRLIHCKSVFTFAMNMYLVGRHWDYSNVLFLISSLPINFSILQWLLLCNNVHCGVY